MFLTEKGAWNRKAEVNILNKQILTSTKASDFIRQLTVARSKRWGKVGKPEEEKCFCSVCGREISKDEYEDYDGMCWECWDDQLTEESDSIFGDFM